MPALPAVSNVVKAQLHWTVDADLLCYSNLYFKYTGGPPNAAACAALAGDVYTAFAACSGDWGAITVLVGARVTDLSSTETGDATHTGSTPGVRGGGNLPGSTAMLVNYQVARRYRGGKPRNYFPWGTDTDLASRQRWDSSFVTDVANDLASTITTILGSSSGGTSLSAHVNVSYYQGTRVVTSPTTGRARNVPILRAVPQVDDIVSLAPSVVLGTQRKRNRA